MIPDDDDNLGCYFCSNAPRAFKPCSTTPGGRKGVSQAGERGGLGRKGGQEPFVQKGLRMCHSPDPFSSPDLKNDS